MMNLDLPGQADLLDEGLWETALRLTCALVAGLLIGIDREMRAKPAGLRSHMLVSLAAASLTVLTFAIVDSADVFGDTVRSDPLRVLEAVVAGVAFLGAGTIIQGRGTVHGITTGASLWLAGALGIASGIGYYQLVVLTLVPALFVLFVLARVEARLTRKERGERAETDEPAPDPSSARPAQHSQVGRPSPKL